MIVLSDNEDYGFSDDSQDEESEAEKEESDADDSEDDDDDDDDDDKNNLKHFVTSTVFRKNYRYLNPSDEACDLAMDLIGKPYLLAGSSLHTLDWSTKFQMLPKYNKAKQKCSATTLKINEDLHQKLFLIENLLSRQESNDIIKRCNDLSLQTVTGHDYKRDTLRMVIFDDMLAQLLWNRLSLLLTELYTGCEVFPLGFNVTSDKWEFSGINQAMRYNVYDSRCEAAFGPHRDAQFCPSGDERTILSLVIYLNDHGVGFNGGETKFYFPKDITKTKESKGFTMKEELEYNNTLHDGYESISIEPSCGNAVLFTPNIIHESTPLSTGRLRKSGGNKYIIKTDVVVKRRNPAGFKISSDEKEDYLKCLNCFRMAQQHELDDQSKRRRRQEKDADEFVDKNLSANELYEKCLSLRYSYPTKQILEEWDLNESKPESQESVFTNESLSQDYEDITEDENYVEKQSPYRIFPAEVWMNIMMLLTEDDVNNLVHVLPGLQPVKCKLEEEWLIPSLIHAHGINTHFEYKHVDFYTKHIEDCCHVLAIYSVFLIGNHKNSNTYTVSYDAEKQEAVVIPLKRLLSDVFYKKPCFGTIMKVMRKGDKPSPLQDLASSTDRRFMANMFSQEFVGCEPIEKQVGCDISELKEPDEYDLLDNENISILDELNAWDKRFTLDGDHNYSYRHENDDNSEHNDEDYGGFVPGPMVYEEVLPDIYTGKYVGAAVTRVLTQPMKLSSSKYCACPLGDWKAPYEMGHFCETRIFNHLIIDFKNQTLNVKEDTDIKKIKNCCVFYEQLLKVVRNELRKKYKVESMNIVPLRCFTVDITKLQNSSEKLSFNHASCNCTFIDHKLQDYVGIRSYPYLNHLHVVTTELNGKILVWTAYGGIAAL